VFTEQPLFIHLLKKNYLLEKREEGIIRKTDMPNDRFEH
jgi:hypothetical protein